MDEGIKRKLVGAAVLVTLVLIILPNITSKTKSAEHLSQSVALETNVPAMAMPLPEPLPILVSPEVREPLPAAKQVVMKDMEVDGQVLPLQGFEIPLTLDNGQAVVWQIQVASFAKVNNALALRDKLRDAGYKAYEQQTPDGKYTRVLVGPSTQKSALQDKLTRIKQAFKLTPELTLFKGS
ncbi:MAG: SPOR domain-containing protein [Bermanella sp.]